ncbi:MAG: MerR family transcriptional regulator [Sulfuricella denitrificans]|nr:MerR family transcriptional regulator [Sulfuricella denitrificans]
MTRKIGLTIGKLAREAGVSIETIRYYHKRGLLIRPSKPEMGGYRSYNEGDVGRIRFIKYAQQMGFSLAEVTELLSHADETNCHATKVLAEKKLKTIEEQLVALEKIRETLKTLIVDCRRDCPRSCPVVLKLYSRFGHLKTPSYEAE